MLGCLDRCTQRVVLKYTCVEIGPKSRSLGTVRGGPYGSPFRDHHESKEGSNPPVPDSAMHVVEGESSLTTSRNSATLGRLACSRHRAGADLTTPWARSSLLGSSWPTTPVNRRGNCVTLRGAEVLGGTVRSSAESNDGLHGKAHKEGEVRWGLLKDGRDQRRNIDAAVKSEDPRTFSDRTLPVMLPLIQP